MRAKKKKRRKKKQAYQSLRRSWQRPQMPSGLEAGGERRGGGKGELLRMYEFNNPR